MPRHSSGRLAEAERAAQSACNRPATPRFRKVPRKGREEASAELKPVLERLARAAADLSNLRDRVRRQAETDLVKLALAIARRVLHRELAIDPDAMQGIVRTALDRLQNREVDRLRVHPSHVGSGAHLPRRSRPRARAGSDRLTHRSIAATPSSRPLSASWTRPLTASCAKSSADSPTN